MYRLNLYPEYELNLHRQRHHTTLTAGLMLMLGIEVVLVGALVLSCSLLSERVRDLSQDLPDFLAKVQTRTQPRPEHELVHTLLELRQKRLDWTPMLSSLAESCGPDMVLKEITGTCRNDRQMPMLEISGVVAKEETSLEEVSAFMQRIRGDHRISCGFDEIELGKIKGGGSGVFDVVCVRKGAKQ